MPNKPVSNVKRMSLFAITLLAISAVYRPFLLASDTDMCPQIQNEYVGRATFYGDATDSNLASGHCGFLGHYGKDVVAVSEDLWADGLACGACFELECFNDTACHEGVKYTVTVTDSCINCGGFSDKGISPGQHFDLSRTAFAAISDLSAGLIQVKATRVACSSLVPSVYIRGTEWWFETRFMGLPGDAGNAELVTIQDAKGTQREMVKSWGGAFELIGQKLEAPFSLTVVDGYNSTWSFPDAIPLGWTTDQAFDIRTDPVPRDRELFATQGAVCPKKLSFETSLPRGSAAVALAHTIQEETSSLVYSSCNSTHM